MKGAPKQVEKVGLRFCDAALRAGNLRRVAGEEVIHRLLGRQARDRRQHAEGIGREHDDVLRMPGIAFGNDVRDAGQRIGGARVLRLRGIVEIERARRRIVNHVLQTVPNIRVVR